MIEPKHILHYMTDRFHDGRYLNGHPEIAEWLSTFPELCYVERLTDELEQLTWNNVRIWHSVGECMQRNAERLETAREFYKRYAEPSVKVEKVLHPLEMELYELCETASTALEFTRVVELKGKLRALGIKVDNNKTSIRRMAKL